MGCNQLSILQIWFVLTVDYNIGLQSIISMKELPVGNIWPMCDQYFLGFNGPYLNKFYIMTDWLNDWLIDWFYTNRQKYMMYITCTDRSIITIGCQLDETFIFSGDQRQITRL